MLCLFAAVVVVDVVVGCGGGAISHTAESKNTIYTLALLRFVYVPSVIF